MKRFLFAYLALVALAWGWALPLDGAGAAPPSAWAVREHALTLTGLWAFALMSLAMVLATRPARLEGAFGGMDRIYRVHKWAGILAIGLAALHWLIELSDGLIKAFFGRDGRLPKDAWQRPLRGDARPRRGLRRARGLRAAGDAGADAVEALSVPALAPSAQDHAGAVPDAGLPRRLPGAHRLLDAAGGHAARAADRLRQRGECACAGRLDRTQPAQRGRDRIGRGTGARPHPGALPARCAVAGPSRRPVRLRRLRPRGRGPSLHHRQRRPRRPPGHVRDQGARRLHARLARRLQAGARD